MTTPLVNYLLTKEPQFRKQRLAALYSDFVPLLSLNPDGYNANISAWRTGLSSAALAGVLPPPSSHFEITINSQLVRELNTPEWGMPLALGTVVKDALDKREWIDGKEFRTSKEGVMRGRWRVPGVGEVVGFGWRLLVGSGDGGRENEMLEKGKGEWKVISLANLELASTEVARRMNEPQNTGRTERVLSLKDFKDQFDGVLGSESERRLSDTDITLLLKFLQRDKQLLITDGSTIRFLNSNEKAIPEEGITLEDSTIASLKTLIKDLTTHITILEKRVNALSTAAKEAVASKNRLSALSSLRSKKIAETALAKRHATLAQVEEVFGKIEQAADQVELVRVMEASTIVLRGLNKEVGGVERVDQVVDSLREQMDVVNEVGGVIGEMGQLGGVGEGEVEEEFEEMERVEREKVEAAEKIKTEEREKREAELKEAREKKEAEETRERLDELAEAERQVRETAARKEAAEKAEKDLIDSTELLKNVSLEPNSDGTALQ